MRLIKIEALENGAHNNQTIDIEMSVPEGWAIVPDDMELPSTFPFVNIEVEDGVVTAMTEGVIPKLEPLPDPEPTATELLDALLGVSE